MAKNKTPEPTTKPTLSKADIQSAFVTDVADLPKSQRSAHTYEWLEAAPKNGIFSAKTLAAAGIYKTAAAAASTLMRLHRAGMVKRLEKNGKVVKGAYQKA